MNALFIVLIHSAPVPERGTWQWWLVEFLGRDGVCRIAVPYFFLVGGFFLAGHICEKRWWFREVQKRLISLVIPYFLWIIIGLCVNFFFYVGIQLYGMSCGFANPFYRPFHLWLINTLGFNPFQNEIGILWFVRDLFVLVIIAPLLIFLLKRTGRFFLLALIFIVYCFVSVLQVNVDKRVYNLFEYFISVRGLLYFTIGLVLRYIHFQDMSSAFTKLGVLLIGCLMVLIKITFIALGYLRIATILDVIMVPILGSGMFIALEHVTLPSWMIGKAFPIYLLHQTFLLFSIVIITLLGFRDMMNASIVIWLIRFTFAVTLSFWVSIFIRNYMPTVSKLLFGGR